MTKTLFQLYERLLLKQPLFAILFSVAITVFFGYFASNFKLDASADSLVLENDQALKYYRSIKARYTSDDFLIITYSPEKDLFDEEILNDIRLLRNELIALPRIDSVTSILDVPLTQSPAVSLAELSDSIRTLETPGMDRSLARKELLSSPLYHNLIISPDAKTTALQLNLKRDETYHQLLQQRNQLREQQLTQKLTNFESKQLDDLSEQFKQYSHDLMDQEKQLIAEVRKLMHKHRHLAKLHLGGVPMIAADSLEYIQHDLQTFGIGVVFFIVFILALAFRKPRWVILPMITCFSAGLIMTGLLGFLDWRVTVVSSNFLSLLLIITLSLTIHLIVRYRELHEQHPQFDQYTLVKNTVQSKFLPAFYTAITTMVAFGSLLVSDIRPVIDFGWMMVIGIFIAFVVSFTFFPAALLFLKPGTPAHLRDVTGIITRYLARWIGRFGIITIIIFSVFTLLSIIGISSLTVENRFIDYYKQHTEIYRGMELIDQQLGGTTPLDIIIDPPASFFEQPETDAELLALATELELEFDDDDEAGITATSYWFNYGMLDQIREIHDYLDQLPETGKVLSIYTTVNMLEQLRDNQDLNDFFLSIIYKRVPDKIRNELIHPYMTEDGNQIRISVRIFESDKSLQRDALLEKIKTHLTENIGLEQDQLHLSGMVVLYNNMLQSLYRSQILTIGVVFLAIMIMFAILFRSFYLAAIAIIPNVFAASMVLGLMGLAGVPLDIMTITIAAICIGIAVDDTIHYIHRYQIEFKQDQDYWQTINRCHASIGRAMYYTTITITLGFSILALSNFIPMIYFGLLTGFSMLIALLADLALLPLLIAYFKPFKNTNP
ncbi:MAG: MMPL family transporter [Gammaproteobacteria bacterium]|nr:MMPL family transporter [Gammaproteobacteria bacterium]